MRIGNSFSLGLETALAGGVEGTQTKYMDADDSDLDIKEDDVSEGEVLAGDIAKTDEFLVGLESLITTMEAAQLDPNFGRYNLPLYHNEACRLHKSLGLSTFGLSTENFDSEYVLSTEGLKETALKVWKAFKDMVARFIKSISERFGKNSKIEKVIEKAEAQKTEADKLVESVTVKERKKRNETLVFRAGLNAPHSSKLGDKITIEEFSHHCDKEMESLKKRFMALGAYLKDLDNIKTVDELDGVLMGHGLKDDHQKPQTKHVEITTKVDPHLVYSSSSAKIIDGGEFERFRKTCLELSGRLDSASSELLRDGFRLTALAEHELGNAVDNYDNDSKKTYDHLNKAGEHSAERDLCNAKRKGLGHGINYLSALSRDVGAVAMDMIHVNDSFRASLNVNGYDKED